jgi:hypothetical protein
MNSLLTFDGAQPHQKGATRRSFYLEELYL